MDDESNDNFSSHNNNTKAEIVPTESTNSENPNTVGEVISATANHKLSPVTTQPTKTTPAATFSSTTSTQVPVAVEMTTVTSVTPVASALADDASTVATVSVDFNGSPSKTATHIIPNATINGADTDIRNGVTPAPTDPVAVPVADADDPTAITAASLNSKNTEPVVAMASTKIDIEKNPQNGAFAHALSEPVKGTDAANIDTAAAPEATLEPTSNATTLPDTDKSSLRSASPTDSAVTTLVVTEPAEATSVRMSASTDTPTTHDTAATQMDIEDTDEKAAPKPKDPFPTTDQTTTSATPAPTGTDDSFSSTAPAQTASVAADAPPAEQPATAVPHQNNVAKRAPSAVDDGPPRKRPRPEGGSTPPSPQRTALTDTPRPEQNKPKPMKLDPGADAFPSSAAEYTASLFASPRKEPDSAATAGATAAAATATATATAATATETATAAGSPESETKLKAKAAKKKKRKAPVNSTKKRGGRKRKKGSGKAALRRKKNTKEFIRRNLDAKWKQYWAVQISKRAIPKCAGRVVKMRQAHMRKRRDLAQLCQRVIRERTRKNLRAGKDVHQRAKRLGRAIQSWWRRKDKERATQKKSRAKQRESKRRHEEEQREAKRQARKLNFLLQQTELFTHFIARKTLKAKTEDGVANSLDQLSKGLPLHLTKELDEDADMAEYSLASAKKTAMARVQQHMARLKQFDVERSASYQEHQHTEQAVSKVSAATRSHMGAGKINLRHEDEKVAVPQPELFRGTLKEYQLQGMNWLVNLYEQGINGILADEMGLGKTVQALSLLMHLAEAKNIWGPFLVVAPASTLHNWHNEVTKFCPAFKALPYWGDITDRKILRKYWDPKKLHARDADFHVLITSYQLLVHDARHFPRVKWEYMVLDEAQAIKSHHSQRWQQTLGFKCRNRLLLSGTPIQNRLAELWSLLHFVMPNFFDSLADFSEWFSKDVDVGGERVKNNSQVSRLHKILKPFMLRRVKKDVEHELAPKLERDIICALSRRQRELYSAIRQRLRLTDLVDANEHPKHRANAKYSNSTQTKAESAGADRKGSASRPGPVPRQLDKLMNVVMELRKVCNHPAISCERWAETPLHFTAQLEGPPEERRRMVRTYRRPLRLHVPKTLFRKGFYGFNHFRSARTERCCRADLRVSESIGDYASSSGFGFLRLSGIGAQGVKALMREPFWKRLVVLLHAHHSRARRLHRLHHTTTRRDGVPTTALDCVAGLHQYRVRQILDRIRVATYRPASSRNARFALRHRRRKGIFRHVSDTVGHWFTSAPAICNHSLKYRVVHADHETAWVDEDFVRCSSLPADGHTSTGALWRGRWVPSLAETEITAWGFPDCHAAQVPQALKCYVPRALAQPVELVCLDQSLVLQQERQCIPPRLSGAVLAPSSNRRPPSRHWVDQELALAQHMRARACLPQRVVLPLASCLVYDCGKFRSLQRLMQHLIFHNHRVLIFSQMTKVLSKLEEFMALHSYAYLRLDGSSSIQDRRDMVSTFQSDPDILCFLLSTRAGGLGINLTAADTVVFYDNDWNPTMDAQAMDRCHRIGQTKQVTVYRLVTGNSVEERILLRAREKHQMQETVYSGKFKSQIFRSSEMVSLLLEDSKTQEPNYDNAVAPPKERAQPETKKQPPADSSTSVECKDTPGVGTVRTADAEAKPSEPKTESMQVES